MAKLGFLKRLVTEDFSKDDQKIISKLAFILNPALEQIVQAMSNNLTFEDNMASMVKEIDVEVDASGKPVSGGAFQSTLNSLCKNIITTRATNLTNSSTYPSGYPFITWEESSKIITIKHIAGLQAGSKYRLRIIATL